MLNYLYQKMDQLWQLLSNIIFVRFAFDLPLERLRSEQDPKKIIFALTGGGVIEWLILSSWCRKNGLGAILITNRLRILLFSKPLIFLKILFARRQMGDLFVSNETGPRLIFCPPGERKTLFTPTDTENLIAELYTSEKLAQSGSQLVFFPIFICWRKYLRGSSRQPMEYFLGLNSRPNFLGKIWYLFRKRTDSTVKALEPLSFSKRESEEGGRDWGGEIEEVEPFKVARRVRRNIIVEVNQEMRIVLGPRYVSPYSVKENIMKDPELFSMVSKLSEETGLDRKKLLGEAYRYLTEISANYAYRFIEVMYVILTWMFGKIFEEISVEKGQIQKLRDTLKTKSAILISCHRSHLDYLVVPGVLFLEDIVTPHIAAGVNLAFWPVGHFLRKGGAFFIRRSFRGQPLYALCLQKYIDWLISNRINIKFFIEGTRSRTGKMLPPAFGLLKMTMHPFETGLVEDLALVPISISYDEVFEEKSYGKELAGGDKVKESATGLVKARKLLKRNIGKVYVRFSDPISLKDEFSGEQSSASKSEIKVEQIALKLCKRINDVTPITPKSIISSVLLAASKQPLTRDEILSSGEALAKFVKWAEMELCLDPEQETLQEALEAHLDKLIRAGTVTVKAPSSSNFMVSGRNRINLVFYKNNSIHCFVSPSIALLAQKANSQDVLNQALILRYLLKFEFFFSPSKDFAGEITNCLQYFQSEKSSHSVFIQLNRDLIESYSIALEVIKTSRFTKESQKTLLQMIVRAAVQKVETSTKYVAECVSTQTFSNSLRFLEHIGVLKMFKEKDQVLVQRIEWNSKAEEALLELHKFHQVIIQC